jgi:hypothetical protein
MRKLSLSWFSRLFVASLLLSSAVIHLSNPYQFYGSILDYQLVPPQGRGRVGRGFV